MESEKLKPCPFCGGDGAPVQPRAGVWAIICLGGDCGAESAHAISEKQAVKKWNTRPPDPVKVALAEALRSVQESLGLLLDPFMGSPRFMLPEGSVARGVVEGAFYGVGVKIEKALAAYKQEATDEAQ